ncbi:hypothetical protein PAUR_a0621 [Pseudoalteromonas aurantia 208]|uniref:Uncharacterized protein n=1 Tax=Pseudoalteromonas aurantia 208 TaxID=1314867 RepID=A0ABR9E8G3_9GAMM|nr:hypothetical protein [Pseudoalteromonas aurantia 208]
MSIALSKVSLLLKAPLLSASINTITLLFDQLFSHDILLRAASLEGLTGQAMTISSLVVAFALANEIVLFKSSRNASERLFCARLLLPDNAIAASIPKIAIAINNSIKVKPRIFLIVYSKPKDSGSYFSFTHYDVVFCSDPISLFANGFRID